MHASMEFVPFIMQPVGSRSQHRLLVLDIEKMNLHIENSAEMTGNKGKVFVAENKKVSEYLFTISAKNT